MKLLDFAWRIATSISGRDHHTLRLILDEELLHPMISRDSKGYLIRLPSPHHTRNSFYTLHGMYFDDDESSWDTPWRLFKASVYHTSLHAAYSDFSSYAPWAKTKELALATYCVSLVEDLRITLKAIDNWKGILRDLGYANYVASLRINDPNEIDNPSLRVATKLLLCVWGVSRNISDNASEDFVIEKVASSIRALVAQTMAKPVDESKVFLSHAAEIVYQAFKGYGSLRQIPSLPYTEAHGDCDVFNNTISELGSADRRLLASAYNAVGLRTEDSDRDDAANLTEGREFFYQGKMAEEKLVKIRNHYEQMIATTGLDSVQFPREDYASYLRIKSALSGSIRNIKDQLRLVKNVLDETGHHESGSVDTQRAIQVVASDSGETDIFSRDEPVHKDEAWAILLDASRSLSTFTYEIRGVATCLAEIVRELVRAQNKWSLLAFNKSLLVIKVRIEWSSCSLADLTTVEPMTEIFATWG